MCSLHHVCQYLGMLYDADIFLTSQCHVHFKSVNNWSENNFFFKIFIFSFFNSYAFCGRSPEAVCFQTIHLSCYNVCWLFLIFCNLLLQLVSSKVIRNKQTSQPEGYGFIEFATRATAEHVLRTYNGQMIPNSEQTFRLNWASAGERRGDDGPDYTIFVGDLAADVTDYILQETFKNHYPSVKGAKIVTDRATGRSKGYGFVRFGDLNEQTRAMTEMDGMYCSSRQMRVGPATTKKNMGAQQNPNKGMTQQTILFIFISSSMCFHCISFNNLLFCQVYFWIMLTDECLSCPSPNHYYHFFQSVWGTVSIYSVSFPSCFFDKYRPFSNGLNHRRLVVIHVVSKQDDMRLSSLRDPNKLQPRCISL